MSVVVSNQDSVSGFTSISAAWDALTSLQFGHSGQIVPKPYINTKYAPDENGNMNPISDWVYRNVPAIQPNDVVQTPVVPSGGYSTSGVLSPNAVDNMFSDTAKLSQDKIFQYFQNLDTTGWGYKSPIPDPSDLPDPTNLFSTTTKVIAAAIIGYLLIK